MAEFISDYALYIIGALAVLAVLICYAVVSGKRRREQEKMTASLNRALEISARRIMDMSQAMEARQDRLRDSLESRMDEMRRADDERYERMRSEMSGRLDARLGESFRTVNEQLERVDKGLGEMRSLAAGVSNLSRIMTNSRARGAWGEVQLRALITDMLAPGQFLENTPVVPGNSERVEFAVVMPDAAGAGTLLAVDSKFPIESYLRLEDDPSGAGFERKLLEEAKRIATKYVKPPHTADCAVMFLPAESLYAEAARRRGLIERIQNEFRVLVSGPSTFAALLTSLRIGFGSVTVEKKSAEVMAALRGVREEFEKYSDTVARAGQRARQLEDELSAVEVRARAVARRLRDIETE